MRRFWPLLIFAVIALVIWLRPDTTQRQETSQQQTPYQRIISLSPSITETVFALGLGDKVVGVTDYCDYPPEARLLPKVGGFTDTSLEAVVSLAPDLVIMLEAHQKLQQQLEQLGIETAVVDNSTLLGIQAGITSIGQQTHSQNQASKLLADIQQQIRQVSQKVDKQPPVRTLVSIAHYVNSEQLDTVYIAGRNDFYNDILQLAGGVNVYQGNHVTVPTVSTEGIITMNPDVIIDIFPEQDDHQSDMNQVRQQWQSLTYVSAVKSGRVHIIEHDYASIPGPRIFRLIPEIARLLHPELDWDDTAYHD